VWEAAPGFAIAYSRRRAWRIAAAIVLVCSLSTAAVWRHVAGHDRAAGQYGSAPVARCDLLGRITATGTVSALVTVQSGTDLDSAEASAASAHASVDGAKASFAQAAAQLHQARINLSNTIIVAPIDGGFISRNVDVGQTVAASPATPTLFSVAQDLTRMQVDANVAEGNVGRLRTGMPTYFTVDAFPDQRFFGGVPQVRNAPTTVQSVVSYDAVLEVENGAPRLPPGMTATVTFVYAQIPHALAVPSAGLRSLPARQTPIAPSARARRCSGPIAPERSGRSSCRPASRTPSSRRFSGTLSMRATKSSPRNPGAPRRRRPEHASSPDDRHPFFEVPMQSVAFELREVTKEYRGRDVTVRALDRVSLRVATGEFVAVMGSSGSGKSTLMNIVGCLDRPTTGAYELAGRCRSVMNPAELARARSRTVGFVFQQFNLLARRSAIENVELPLEYAGVGRRERRRRAVRTLLSVGLEGQLQRHPHQLSGGYQQRVAIARAIVNDPRIVLADEPTGGLDSQTTVEVLGLFRRLWLSGLTLVLVTHDPQVAAYASRVIVMRDGRIVRDQPQEPRCAELDSRRIEGAP